MYVSQMHVEDVFAWLYGQLRMSDRLINELINVRAIVKECPGSYILLLAVEVVTSLTSDVTDQFRDVTDLFYYKVGAWQEYFHFREHPINMQALRIISCFVEDKSNYLYTRSTCRLSVSYFISCRITVTICTPDQHVGPPYHILFRAG